MKKSMPPNAVTVVVPVYGDWDSLAQCIDSLLLNVTSLHQVILVNDVGPNADFLESAILEKISGLPNFRYFRNEANIGFVKTCNRAAYELDTTDNDILLLNSDTITTPGFIEEMATVLALSSRHGTVCPRSNNATIASIPLNFKNSEILERDIDYARDLHTSLSGRLPRFSIVPVTPGILHANTAYSNKEFQFVRRNLRTRIQRRERLLPTNQQVRLLFRHGEPRVRSTSGN